MFEVRDPSRFPVDLLAYENRDFNDGSKDDR